MCRRILPVVLLTSILFFSCKKNDVITVNDPGPGGNNNSSIVYNVNKVTLLQLANDVRKKGCTCGTTTMPAVGALAWNDQLAKAGFEHSLDMNTHDYFSHTGLDSSTPGERIIAAGYVWMSYGENIANGYTTEQAVMDGWLGSEDHCKNIMNGAFKDMGVGRDGNYWTQELGSK